MLELVNSGLAREEAYKIVQSNAMKVKQNNSDFLAELKQDKPLLKVINSEKLEYLFDLKYNTKHVSHINSMVFN